MENSQQVLHLDAHTLADLGLFDSSAEVGGLFEFCNRCRTHQGSEALKRRMLSPWAGAAGVRETQISIGFIGARRRAFDALPSAYLATNIERYLSAGMPCIRAENSLEFGLEAFQLWANYDQYYSRIVHGLELCFRLSTSLREMIDCLELHKPPGEIGVLLLEMRSLLEKQDLQSVKKNQAAKRYWQKLRIDQKLRVREKLSLLRLLELCSEIDALVAMTDVTCQSGWIMPRVMDGPTMLEAKDLVHPLLPDAVANSVSLDQNKRVLFLTGPNMAGKTTYLRTILVALYFAHLGMGVPAAAFAFSPLQHLISSISLNDSLSEGVSYFRAEAPRVKAVAQAVHDGGRTIAVMDEPFKGTNVKDAFDASLAIVKEFSDKADCLFVIASHLIELSDSLQFTQGIDYRFFEAGEGSAKLSFDYRLKLGVSSQRLGMRVLVEEGVFDLLDDSHR
jgi:DNA mismatch repair ATPase MutS